MRNCPPTQVDAFDPATLQSVAQRAVLRVYAVTSADRLTGIGMAALLGMYMPDCHHHKQVKQPAAECHQVSSHRIILLYLTLL